MINSIISIEIILINDATYPDGSIGFKSAT